MDDNDRSLGFRAAREQLVEKVNAVLAHAVARQNRGEALFFATGHVNPIENESRIVKRVLGPHPTIPNATHTVETRKLGISLTGDGSRTPLELQAVYPSSAGVVASVEIIGAAPGLRRDEHGAVHYNESTAHLVTASVKVRSYFRENNENMESVAEYQVYGNGHVQVAQLQPEGLSAEDYDAQAIEGMHYAQTLVDHVAHDIGIGAKPEAV